MPQRQTVINARCNENMTIGMARNEVDGVIGRCES